MSDTITISVERVREAAKSCPDAKRVLQILAPEAFSPEDDIVPPPRDFRAVGSNGYYYLAVRSSGDYERRGLYLGIALQWEIVNDCGYQVLIARRKVQP